MTADSAAPQVSVVVPVRDGGAFVADACRSALDQREVIVEVVVVENGSTDDTVEQVLALGDERVRLLRQDRPGVSAARNRGIAEATGRWVAFLDADDRWHPDKLRRQLDLAAATGATFVFSDCRLVSAGTVHPQTFHQVNPPPEDGAALLPALVERPSFVPLSTVVVDRRLVSDVGSFRADLSHSEDWELWLRLALHGAAWACVRAPLVDYTVNPAGASRDNRAIFTGERLALDGLRTELAAAGLGDASDRRTRRARGLAVVYGRRPDATLGERLRDLRDLVSRPPSWRSVAGQLAYTVAPRRSTPSAGLTASPDGRDTF